MQLLIPGCTHVCFVQTCRAREVMQQEEPAEARPFQSTPGNRELESELQRRTGMNRMLPMLLASSPQPVIHQVVPLFDPPGDPGPGQPI